MANNFLKILPFRPARKPAKPVRRRTVILPAEDILNFEYPPQSSFHREHDVAVAETLLKG